jgi:O-antigen/teichoic acid export membrane protein
LQGLNAGEGATSDWPIHSVLSKHLTNGLIVLAGQMSVAVSGLVMVRVMTEHLLPADYGLLTLGITFALMANQVIFGPLGSGLTRFFAAAAESRETDAFLKAATTLTKYAAAILVSIAGIAVLVLFLLGSFRWATLLGLGLMFSLASGFYSLINGIFLAKNAQKTLTIFQSSEPVARLAFAVLLMALLGATAEVALAGYMLGTLIIVLLQMARINYTDPVHNVVDSGITAKWLGKILHYGAPYATWGVFTTINLASDRWVLKWAQGQDQVGLYAALYQIGYLPVIMLVSIFAQIITPHLYKTAGDGTDHERLTGVYSVVKKAVAACMGATFILMIMGYFLHGLLYAWFVSKSYASVSKYLPLMILAAGIFASAQIASLRLHSGVSTTQLIPVKIGCAVIGIILNVIFGIHYGVFGIVLAQLVTSFTFLIWIFAIGPKK